LIPVRSLLLHKHRLGRDHGGFIASGPTTQLNFFFETDDGTGTWQIDDVSVEAASAPDGGSTIALLGLAMTASLGRRKFGHLK
jgi:hypothetical protein